MSSGILGTSEIQKLIDDGYVQSDWDVLPDQISIPLRAYVQSDEGCECYDSLEFAPGETKLIPCDVEMDLPADVCAFVQSRCSLLLKGLVVHGPVYSPTHRCRVHIVVQNMSAAPVVSEDCFDYGVANMFFAHVDGMVERPYRGQFDLWDLGCYCEPRTIWREDAKKEA